MEFSLLGGFLFLTSPRNAKVSSYGHHRAGRNSEVWAFLGAGMPTKVPVLLSPFLSCDQAIMPSLSCLPEYLFVAA